MIFDLRHGRWQGVLGDVSKVTAIITDPPYSDRTHKGRRTGSEVRQSAIPYDALTPEDVHEFVTRWAALDPAWWVIFADHVTAGWWRNSLAAAGQYVCGPVRWVKPDAAPNMCGTGTASSTEDIVVARWAHNPQVKRSRPGHYIEPTASTRGNTGGAVVGAKPLNLMRRIIADYTMPGDVVCDPFAGSGTTLVAALEADCLPVGSESDAGRYALAHSRLSAVAQHERLPGIARGRSRQSSMTLSMDDPPARI